MDFVFINFVLPLQEPVLNETVQNKHFNGTWTTIAQSIVSIALFGNKGLAFPIGCRVECFHLSMRLKLTCVSFHVVFLCVVDTKQTSHCCIMTSARFTMNYWDVLKDLDQEGLQHQIEKFAISNGSAFLLTSQGQLLAFGHNNHGLLGLGHKQKVLDKLEDIVELQSKQVVDLTFGLYHVVALTRDGQTWTWGRNDCCQLGRRERTDHLVPRLLCSDIAAIQSGWGHSLALTKSGRVLAWGSNFSYQIGNDSNERDTTLVPVTSLQSEVIIRIACGSSHSLALSEDGRLYAWGKNGSGQLGIGDLINQSVPVQVLPLANHSSIKEIACGDSHSMVLLEDGSIWAWGDNSFGQLGRPTYTKNKSFPVRVNSDVQVFQSIVCDGNFSAAIASDGHVHILGRMRSIGLEMLQRSLFTSLEDAFHFIDSISTPRNRLMLNKKIVEEQTSFTTIVHDQLALVTPTSCAFVENLGHGSFGVVECVQHCVLKLKMAIKKINLFKYKNDEHSKTKYIRSEVDIMEKLSRQCSQVV